MVLSCLDTIGVFILPYLLLFNMVAFATMASYHLNYRGARIKNNYNSIYTHPVGTPDDGVCVNGRLNEKTRFTAPSGK